MHLVHGTNAKRNKTMVTMYLRNVCLDVIIVTNLDNPIEVIKKTSITW